LLIGPEHGTTETASLRHCSRNVKGKGSEGIQEKESKKARKENSNTRKQTKVYIEIEKEIK
jgi:hypothetical protein